MKAHSSLATLSKNGTGSYRPLICPHQLSYYAILKEYSYQSCRLQHPESCRREGERSTKTARSPSPSPGMRNFQKNKQNAHRDHRKPDQLFANRCGRVRSSMLPGREPKRGNIFGMNGQHYFKFLDTFR